MYPWFLLGLLGIAIPVLIHLLQLRRPQRLFFTNTSFIREVEMVTVRHRKVQHLLILVARVLAISSLVLMFCQPFIPATGVEKSSPGVGTDVLVDNSFSMQQPGSIQSSLLKEAVEEARDLGKLASSGTKLRLKNGGNRLITLSEYQSALDELKFTSKAPLSNIGGMKEGLSSSGKLFIFSDFQKNAFDGSSLKDLPENSETVLVPIPTNSIGNVYVDSVWLDDAFVRMRTNIGLHVRLRNGGSLAAVDCPVKVFLNAKQVAAFRVTVEPGEAVATVVQVQVEDEKLALGQVVTEDRPVTFDNTYYFTLQPAAAIQVHEIAAEPASQPLYGNEPLFKYIHSKPQSLNYGLLRQADLVIVREINQVDAGLREGLRAVVKRGGSVVIIPTAMVSAQASYQQLFKELGLGSAQWSANTATPELRDVAMPNAQEPFFRDVFGAQQRAVTMPRVAPVLRWSRTGTDILRLRDGESYLSSFASGAGKVYVFTAPFSKEYSDFVQHALFVPVMYRVAMLSYLNEQLPAYRLTQAMVGLKLPAISQATNSTAGGADEVGFRLVKDSLTLIPTQRVLGQEVRLDLPVGMDAPGFYQVQRRGKVVTTLAFNQDKKESELAAYTAAELRELIGPDKPNIKVLEGGTDGAALAKFRAEQTGQPLWRYFLAFTLACLLAEALLVRLASRRIGTAQAKAVA
ncbi:N-terminal double-transmembrane domain-containing protein [Hymenobacter arizonensis]|uniref:N-terminal double-transmembrane domain-containing protein n=2 Tax=Hymenobacter arizonensis TaxID=1227077 RepID=A0A1I5SBM9_HYMAR|nr:N-terminal double-transmembrane domain-containing protein [Hymenobacter arizonensis]